ncbi:hypothetical protein [Cyanothece sp. BG0011]|uniref:hypothetical protein n=1 Tax=Cyanothece sp. BG0011 TaxID=2082950 RepID=UPI000D1E505F|nr:hypothetical protein [Cyanothece sp. BG0011]
MLLKLSLENELKMGREFQKELAQLTDEKEIALFFENCGGEDVVQSRIRVPKWWDSLTEDWRHKILNAPFKFVNEHLWFKLSQLNFEGLQQWYEDIIERSQKNLKKNGRKTLSLNICNKVVSKILPKPKRIKRVLKLHQPVAKKDFNVLLHQKDYNFTLESLEEFIAQVREGVKEQPIVTESLFPFLKDKGLDPLLILSANDRFKFVQSQLDERDKQVEQLIEEKQEQQEEISQLKQQNESQQVQINNLEEELTKQREQFNERMEAFEKFMASQTAA